MPRDRTETRGSAHENVPPAHPHEGPRAAALGVRRHPLERLHVASSGLDFAHGPGHPGAVPRLSELRQQPGGRRSPSGGAPAVRRRRRGGSREAPVGHRGAAANGDRGTPDPAAFGPRSARPSSASSTTSSWWRTPPRAGSTSAPPRGSATRISGPTGGGSRRSAPPSPPPRRTSGAERGGAGARPANLPSRSAPFPEQRSFLCFEKVHPRSRRDGCSSDRNVPVPSVRAEARRTNPSGLGLARTNRGFFRATGPAAGRGVFCVDGSRAGRTRNRCRIRRAGSFPFRSRSRRPTSEAPQEESCNPPILP